MVKLGEILETICIIPARLNSTRLKHKMLRMLGEVPLMIATYRAAVATGDFDRVILAVDDPLLVKEAHKWDAEAKLTSKEHESGTQRLIEVATAENREALWVNWQGDEPFLKKEHISALLQNVEPRNLGVYSLKTPICSNEEFHDPSAVKVVTNHKNRALYFSRSPIPYGNFQKAYKHLGIYAYTHSALEKIKKLSFCPLAKTEKLEQLNFLSADIPIWVPTVQEGSIGIDTLEDFERALSLT